MALPLTVALNCWLWPAFKLMAVGLTATPTGGSSVTAALADFVGSATDVAVTVRLSVVETTVGATYEPVDERVPIIGFIDQVTEVFVVPVTEALNGWLWPPCTMTAVGLMLSDTVGALLPLPYA